MKSVRKRMAKGRGDFVQRGAAQRVQKKDKTAASQF
jgi:hypothetical protein